MHSGFTVLRPAEKRLTKDLWSAVLIELYHCCYFIHSLFLCLKRVVYKYTVYQQAPSTQSESEQSLVLEDLCFRFPFLFFLSFFFLSFFFFLFLLRCWSEEEEEEDELSESEEVVSWSSCCSCWILETGRAGRRGEDGRRWGLESSTDRRTQLMQTRMLGVGKHLKCPWARHCPSASISGLWS